MQVPNWRADCSDIANLLMNWRVRMAKENVRDKLLFEAGFAETLTPHIGTEEVPRQRSVRLDALLEGDVMGCHNDLRDRIFY